jgi:hypothetical protein
MVDAKTGGKDEANKRFICRHCSCRFRENGEVIEHGRSVEE